MTAEKNSHEEIKLLLPWYLSGKLGADELETVKRHLSECDDCAGEIEELSFMGAAITEPDEALDAAIKMRLPDMEADTRGQARPDVPQPIQIVRRERTASGSAA